MMGFKKFSHLIQGRSRRYLLASTVLGLLWFLIELSFVYILQGFLFSLGLIDASKLNLPSWYPSGIIYSVVFIILFGSFRSLVNYAKSFFSAVSQQAFNRSQREKLVQYGLDSSQFTSAADYITAFSEKVNQSGVFVQYLSLLVVSLTSVVLFLIFGFYYAPYEMLFSLGLLALIMIPLKKKTQLIQKTGSALLSGWTQINSEILLNRTNLFFLRVYDLVERQKNELNKHLQSYEKSYFSYASSASFLSSLPMFVGVVVLGLCSYMSVTYFKTDGVKVLSFFYIFLRLSLGLSETNSTYAVLKLSYPAFEDLSDLIKKIEVASAKEKQIASTDTHKHLELVSTKLLMEVNQLYFSYNPAIPILKNFNLRLDESDILVIKGPSGAGKSTLLKLLLGIEAPTSGQVLLNQTPVMELDSKWRQSLGYVGPEPYLIRGTIRENLCFGHYAAESITDEQCWHVLQRVGLLGEFKQMRLSLDDVLSESSFLSTGQKQRLSIARAFLRQPRVMIFDEATANLDMDSESKILASIQELAHRMLIIIVTHKNSFDNLGTKFVQVGKE